MRFGSAFVVASLCEYESSMQGAMKRIVFAPSLVREVRNELVRQKSAVMLTDMIRCLIRC